MSSSNTEVKVFFDYVRGIIDQNKILISVDPHTTIKIRSIETKFEEVVLLALGGEIEKIENKLVEISKEVFSLGRSTLDKNAQNLNSQIETLLGDLPFDRRRIYERDLRDIQNRKTAILKDAQFSRDISFLQGMIEDLYQMLKELSHLKDSVIEERRLNVVGSFKNAIFLIIGAIMSFLIGALLDDFLLFILILVGLICSYYLYQYYRRTNKKWLSIFPSLFVILIVGILKYPEYYPMIANRLMNNIFEEGMIASARILIGSSVLFIIFIPIISEAILSRFVKREVRRNLVLDPIGTKPAKIKNELFGELGELIEISFILKCEVPIIKISFHFNGVGIETKSISPYSANYIPESGLNLKLHFYIPKDVPQMLEGKRKLILSMSGYFLEGNSLILKLLHALDYVNLSRKEEMRFELEFDFSHLLLKI